MTTTATSTLASDPQRAWQTVLGQLQMEMPRASYDTWVRDTKALSYKEGHLTIGVRNAYARDWLESRLQSTVSRLLIGIMNRAVEVDFVICQPDLIEDDDLGEENDHEIELASSSHYEEEVKPQRVVVIPGYALRLLAQGDLSAREMSLWMSFRQAAYFDWKKSKGGVSFTRNIPHQEIIKFANMSRTSFFREIRGKDFLAEGMIQRLPEMGGGGFNPHMDNANRWKVSMSPRLTRRDAAVIELILSTDIALAEETTEARKAAALHSLDEMAKRSPSDYLDMEIKRPKHAPANVIEILRRALGLEDDIPAALFEASEALQNKLMSAYGSVVITHHFLTEVAPHFGLTQSQVWTAIVLRDRSYYDYESGIEHDFVMAPQGLESIAGWIGVSVKSLKRWLEQDEFRQFVQVLKVEIPENDLSEGADRLRQFLGAGGLILNVRKEEPALGYLCDEESERLIPLWTKWDPALDKVVLGLGQSETRLETKWDSALDKVGLGFGQSGTPLNNLYKPLLNPYKPHKPQPTNPKAKTSPLAQGGGGWDISSLLKLNPVSDPKIRKRILEKGDPIALVSWLLYGYSPEGEGINSPSNLAISNLASNPGQGARQIYQGIALLGPDKLRKLIDDLSQPYQLGQAEDESGFLRIFKKTPPEKIHELASCLFEENWQLKSN
jgi:hypothetical protein